MDRLVKVEAGAVELHFRPSERCAAAFKVTSLIHTMPVAVQLTTTRPALFSFSPSPAALLLPLSSAVFHLVLPPTMAPPLSLPPELLVVRSALAPALHRADAAAAVLRFFSRRALPIFRDASLPIYLLGPHVLRSIIVPSISGDLALPNHLLPRVIASCSPADLSEILPIAAAGAAVADISALIAAGADPNARGSDGKSTISIAISAGRFDVVKTLIEAGAIDRPFFEAAEIARTDLILLLAKSGFALNWADSADTDGRTPVHAAAAVGGVDALRFCLFAGGGDADLADARGWTPLHYAAAGGHLAAADLIINSSAFDPRLALTREGPGKKRRTPLDLAAEKGHNHLYELLHPAGRGGKRDQNGWTALHVAAFKGRLDTVRKLVEGGAEIEAVDDGGYTPLRCAREAGHEEVAMWLDNHRAGYSPANSWESCGGEVSAGVCRTRSKCSNHSSGIEA